MKKPIPHTQKILLSVFCALFFSYGFVFAIDVISENILAQSATDTGSNNSQVSILSWWIDQTNYINAWDNSAIIGNYFSGYYYDTVYGFFRLDWSNNLSNNVRIVSWTDACAQGYGYKIGWYAYSESAGLIDFDYNNDIYVYYCLSDKKMHGYSYSNILGFQSFEGIGFDVLTSPISETQAPTSNDSFINDQTQITELSSPLDPNNASNNSPPTIIWSDIFEFLDTDESIFYIIK